MAQDRKKVLVEVYKWYGGSLEPEFSHELLGEDSQEFRKQVVDSNIPNHAHVSEKELAQFIQGETDNIYVDLEVTDWDEPQGVFVTTSTEDEKYAYAHDKFEAEIKHIARLFEGEDNQD